MILKEIPIYNILLPSPKKLDPAFKQRLQESDVPYLPILVREISPEIYQLIDGYHRLWIVKDQQEKQIMALVVDWSNEQVIAFKGFYDKK